MVLITQSGPDTLPIGTPAPHFSLLGTDGKTYTLDGLSSGRALVLNFTCNHCPYAKAYEDRFMAIVREYSPQGIAFAAINPNDEQTYPDDSFENMKLRAAQRGFNFPYLHDPTQKTARAYGAVCTPHLFIVQDGKIAYEGRIDDNWKEPAAAQHHDLRNALAAILANQPIPATNTNPMGCSIKWKT
ncbi:MAG: thioredoxin family protein [Kiritimatiellae bacterium]|nr:thioredoxin family protein [Kiritimatiellia bacterium]MCO5068261.1 thioredoxin family protein [Kiritimatiellia bacterium]